MRRQLHVLDWLVGERVSPDVMWGGTWRVRRACLQQCSIHQRGEAGYAWKRAHKQVTSFFWERTLEAFSRKAQMVKLPSRLLQVSSLSHGVERLRKEVRKLLGESRVRLLWLTVAKYSEICQCCWVCVLCACTQIAFCVSNHTPALTECVRASLSTLFLASCECSWLEFDRL